ncbi:MAG TPA: hypothetical protein VFA57_17860 [Pseudolabrys sp.]|jgi:hypothetical protein|nr:hypothetical protein [Pseudolabrys sp.]
MAEPNAPSRPAETPADYAAINDGSNLKSDSGGALSGITESMKDRARSFAEEQKAAGSERMEAVGRAVHDAADRLGQEMPAAAEYIHSAADTLENVSARLRNRSIDDLVARLDRFARKQPAAAFAGSVLAGFALSRFLKSSSH